MNRAVLKRVLPAPAVSVLKTLRTGYRQIFLFLETKVMPFAAFKLTFLVWPAYKILQKQNYCFLANIPDSDGVGHILVETDDFLRRRFLKEIDPKRKYLLIKKTHRLSKEFLSLYKHHFHWAVCSSLLYYLTLPLILRYESIRLDCGLSRSKWHPLNAQDCVLNPDLPAWPKIITKHKNLKEWAERYRRRHLSDGFFPLKQLPQPEPSFEKFCSPRKEQKTALIHLKTNIANATAKTTDPETYLPAIEYLLDLNYHLIFIGREKFPAAFMKYGLLNYSQSKFANFQNDLLLFNRADLAIMGGSGAFLFADCLNVKLLYLNYWHLFRLPGTSQAICIPTLVQKKSGELLSFLEQWDLYKRADDAKAEVFPMDLYDARNASGDEILAGCQELIDGKSLPTKNQKKFSQLSNYYCGESKISNYFVNKHEKLIR